MHRALSLLLAVFLVACGGDDFPNDAPEASGDPAAATSDADTQADGAVDSNLVGFWTQAYTQYSPDGDRRTAGTVIYWTLREDGTALEAKQDDRLGPDPLTADYRWARSGDRLSFSHTYDGADGPQWDVIRLEGDTLTVKKADREDYSTFARGPAE